MDVKLVIAKKPAIFSKIYYATHIRSSKGASNGSVEVLFKGEHSNIVERSDSERKAVLQLAEDMKTGVGKIIAKVERTEAEVSKTVDEASKRMTQALMTEQIVSRIKANPFEKE